MPAPPFVLYDCPSIFTLSNSPCGIEPYPVIDFAFKFRRHAITYWTGILLPMILSTFAGFFAFVANPSSGERLGLGITVMLTNAAIYIVAFEVLPKGADWTTITLMHIVSFCFALATLAISLVTISLYCVQSSDASESQLLNSFVAADADGSGDIDKAELAIMLNGIGLAPAVKKRLVATLGKHSVDKLTLDTWYDVVAEVYQHTDLSAFHSWMLGRMLVPLIQRERTKRKAHVLARVGCDLREHAAEIKGSSPRELTTESPRAAPYKVKSIRVAPTDAGAPPSADAAPPSPKKPLEAAVTDSGLEDDLADPTEYVARNAAGYIDMAAAVVLPLAYLVLVLVLLGGGSEGAWGRAGFDGTEIRHLHDGAWTRWAR